jgi:putative membrane protein
MAKLSGKEFDRTYAKMMVDDHKKAVALFKEQAEKGEDAEVRQAAATTLPTLEEHLQMAEKLAGEVGASQ